MERRMQGSILREQYYTDGNVVRKEYVAEPYYEAPARRREVEQPRPRTVEKEAQKRQVVLEMNPVFAIFLALSIIATLAACVSLLTMQNKVTNQSDTITSLQANLEALQEDNDAYETRINDSVDLEAIRTDAIDRLGMVYPTEGQVVYYDITKSDYVRQYKDVPAAN